MKSGGKWNPGVKSGGKWNPSVKSGGKWDPTQTGVKRAGAVKENSVENILLTQVVLGAWYGRNWSFERSF